jgi:uncharacterized protein YbbC (DUF1343 family)
MRASWLVWAPLLLVGCAGGPYRVPPLVGEMPLPPVAVAPPPPPAPTPVAARERLADTAIAEIDAAVSASIAAHKIPGCVVAIGTHDAVLFSRAYGSRAIEPEVVAMTEDTVFDLASLTKPLATASSIMVLAERGKVDLDAPLKTYLPELGDRGVGTLRQTLTHTAGFLADTPLSEYDGMSTALRGIARRRLRYAPGAEMHYSDVGFLLLGEIVRRVSGEELSAFAAEAVFTPLGMSETGFLPGPALVQRAAPTEKVEGRWLTGEVHDPRARLLGGVAGHAGLFSTARDLERFAQAMLSGHPSFATHASLQAYTAPHDLPGAIRALGWDVHSPYSTNRGTLLSPRAYGHGGYTGTSFWIDPERDLFLIVLSNRVHPTGKGEVNPLAGAIADIAVRATSEQPATGVRTGLDAIAAEGWKRLRGKHVGLITNAAGRTRDGVRDVDSLAHAEGVHLVALFAPEHGLGSTEDAIVADERDAATGLPVYSLYGAHFTPTDAELAGVDTLLVDLPDVGVRFFTYASTLHRAMAKAAKLGISVVVLDRPNPLGGVRVEGPVPATAGKGFVNHARLPVRHGMTMGELAYLFNAEDHMGADLTVVRAEGWTRDKLWTDTGLPWVPPSPNLRSETEALLYPGVALLEATNVSVGRGTDTPFEVVGAPWIDGVKLAAELTRENPQGLHGVTWSPTSFVPTSSVHHGTTCSGLRFVVNDAANFAPVELGVALAVALHRLYPTTWEVAKLAPLLQSAAALAAVERGATASDVTGTWAGEAARFAEKRAKYLIYR